MYKEIPIRLSADFLVDCRPDGSNMIYSKWQKKVHQEYPTQQGYHLGLKEKELYREAKAKRVQHN